MLDGFILNMIDERGYNGIKDSDIKKVGDEIIKEDIKNVDRENFNRICNNCNIDSCNFSDEDLEKLNDYLNN